MCVFLPNLKKPKFHTFKKIYTREERFREACDVITEELSSSSSSLKFARQRERERERERKEHTRTRTLKPRERTTTHKKSRHRHVFCATTTPPPPVVEFDFDLLRNDQKNTVRKIRHREIFFPSLSLSLSLFVARLGSGCFATRSSSRRGLLLYFTFSSFSSSSSSSR
jgi:hypothetical protein